MAFCCYFWLCQSGLKLKLIKYFYQFVFIFSRLRKRQTGGNFAENMKGFENQNFQDPEFQFLHISGIERVMYLCIS